MNHVIKHFLALSLRPLLRFAGPKVEQLRQLRAFLVLSAQLRPALHPSVVVLGVPELSGTKRISLGRDLRLYPSLYLETRDSGTIDIGDGVVISRGVHIVAHAGITIGAGSMIGEYTSIRDGNHRRDSLGAIRETGHESKPISIGKQVWIGRGVTILPGVNIGDDATVGANAVVTHDVPPGVAVAGVPARALPARQSMKSIATFV